MPPDSSADSPPPAPAGTAADQAAASTSVLSSKEIAEILKVQINQAEQGLRAYITKLGQETKDEDRLPVLDIILDRFVRALNTSMRNFTSENVDISLDNMYTTRYGEFLSQLPSPVMLGVVRSSNWQGFMLMVFETPLIYAVVDVLLGGRRGGEKSTLEGRTFTTIERRMMTRLMKAVIGDLEATFQAVAEAGFAFDRLEINPRFARLTRPDALSIVAILRFYMEDRGGKIFFCFPSALFHPVRDILSQPFFGDSSEVDSSWVTQINQQTLVTHVGVEVILDTVRSTLGDIMNWRPGQRIDLKTKINAPVDVRVDNISIGRAELGRRGGNLAVRLV